MLLLVVTLYSVLLQLMAVVAVVTISIPQVKVAALVVAVVLTQVLVAE